MSALPALHCKEDKVAAFSEASFFSFLWVPQSASNTALQEVSQQQYVVHQTFLPLIFSTIVFNGNTFASFICPSNYLISVQTLKKKKKKKRLCGHSVYSSAAVQHCFILTFPLPADLSLLCDFVQPASCTSCAPQRPRNLLRYAQRWLRRGPPPTQRALQNRT